MYVFRFKTVLLFLALFCALAFSLNYFIIQDRGGAYEELAVSGDASVELPIIMYHGVIDQSKWVNEYVISKESFESDLIYLKQNGYTTVTIGEVIDYVYSGAPLPEKPIVLTFDDGFYNNLSIVYPLLEKYNMKAVISVVGAYTDKYSELDDKNPGYAYLSWDDVRFLSKSGLVEIGNHSYDMHSIDSARNGTKKNKNESEEHYRKALTEDAGKMQELCAENLGFEPAVFTYPYGAISECSIDILNEIGFKASLSCEERMNYISVGDTSSLCCMNRFFRSNDKPLSSILKNQ